MSQSPTHDFGASGYCLHGCGINARQIVAASFVCVPLGDHRIDCAWQLDQYPHECTCRPVTQPRDDDWLTTVEF